MGVSSCLKTIQCDASDDLFVRSIFEFVCVRFVKSGTEFVEFVSTIRISVVAMQTNQLIAVLFLVN